MNFKIISMLSIILFLSSCGTKGDPVYPKGTDIIAWPKAYDIDYKNKQSENKRKE